MKLQKLLERKNSVSNINYLTFMVLFAFISENSGANNRVHSLLYFSSASVLLKVINFCLCPFSCPFEIYMSRSAALMAIRSKFYMSRLAVRTACVLTIFSSPSRRCEQIHR